MTTIKSRISARSVGRVVLAVAALGALGGCVAVPYNNAYYGDPGYGYAQPVYAAPAYVGPAVNLGFSFGNGGYYRGGPRYGHGYRGWR